MGGLILIACATRLIGLSHDLPTIAHVDERSRTLIAIRMAASGDLNPGWFGHPASTVLYPLAGIYHGWHVITDNRPFFEVDPDLQTHFYNHPQETYFLGRLLAAGYSLLMIPLIYHIGRQAFGPPVGLLAAWLSILSPTVMHYAQRARGDDISATFFGLLSLWLCLRLYHRPTLGNHILAGLTIGLAIGSRYFMVALVPILVAVEGFIWWRRISQPSLATSWRYLRSIAGRLVAGLLSVLVGFALCTPYFFLDFATVLANLRHEARTVELGADGLTPPENLWWYLTTAIPDDLSWPVTVFAAGGVGLILYHRQPKPLLLLGFVTIFLLGLSLSALHWQRWIVQILPVLALFAAYGLQGLSHRLAAFQKLSHRQWLSLLLILVSLWPTYHLTMQTIRNTQPSTRLLARNWLIHNLPAQSQVATEGVVPLTDTQFYVFEAEVSLATEGYTLEEAQQLGWQYFVASADRYGVYFSQPDRYPAEVAFYENLFHTGQLIQQFEPTATRNGPTIRVYQLPLP